MESVKYVGLDVHQNTISVAVLDADGKLVMQSVLATHAAAHSRILFTAYAGTLHVTFEKERIPPGCTICWCGQRGELVVCNPPQNALLKAGNKSDRIDARKLAELLRAGLLSPVYHGENSTAAVKHLCRSYAALTDDTTRVKAASKRSTAARPLLAPARSLTDHAIATSGWRS